MIRPEFRRGGRAVAPFVIPVLVFGASFGILARATGMGILAPIVMSATTFAGSAQFAATSILGAGGGAAAAISAALLLNARFTPIGLSVAHAIPGTGWRRLLRTQLIIDASWAAAFTPSGTSGERLIGAGILMYVAWMVGTVVGVLGAGALGDPGVLGLDAAIPAVFLTMLVRQIRGRRPFAAAVAGAAIALLLLPWTPPGVPVIAATASILLGWRGGGI